MLLAFFWSAFAVRDKPYGLRVLDVFILALYGPLVPDIRDYDPDEQPTPSGSGRPPGS